MRCGALPAFASRLRVAGGVLRHTEPIVDVALIRQRMIGLAEIFRRLKRGGEQLHRSLRVTLPQRAAAEREMRAHMLPERQAFAALPRLEFSRAKERQRLFVLRGLVVEAGEFDGEIVAQVHEIAMAFEFREADGGLLAGALPELVALVEDASVGRIARRSARSNAAFALAASASTLK